MTCALLRMNSTRFGEISFKPSEIINFEPGGLLGFENETTFVMVDLEDSTLIQWMQSTQTGNLAFPVLEAAGVLPELNERMQLKSYEVAYYIMTIPNNVTEMTINSRAPIIINNSNMTAKQVIQEDKKLTSVNQPIYADLRLLIVSI